MAELLDHDPTSVPPIIMGIELKGWFALAKEGEPSFRYTVNPDACADADLLVVFPWILDEVVSGRPRLMPPFVLEARYAASHRNHYWTYMRGVLGEAAAVMPAEHRQPYPRKSDKYLDRAARDAGGNFGRIARGQIMDSYIAQLFSRPVAGIPMGAWQRFFKIFTDAHTEATIRRQLAVIERLFAESGSSEAKERFDRLVAAIVALRTPSQRPHAAPGARRQGRLRRGSRARAGGGRRVRACRAAPAAGSPCGRRPPRRSP